MDLLGEGFRMADCVRMASDSDGVVLLDLRSGRYLAPNAVGCAVIQGVRAGRTLEAVACGLTASLGVPPERVLGDVRRFLGQLVDTGLAERSTGRRPPRARVTRDVVADPAPVPAIDAPVRIEPGLLVVQAYLSLLVADAARLLLGFRRLHTLLHRVPLGPRRLSPLQVGRLAVAVHRAEAMYVRRARCLERSVALVLLLRARRAPARLVLGVKRMPFSAHAWVELDGRVVNDRPTVRQRYAVIERC